MPRKAVLGLGLVQSICSVAALIAAKMFGLTLPQLLLLRTGELLQSVDKGVFA